MRVGLVIPGHLDFPSGGFLYDRQLVAELRRSGDQVDVISVPWDPWAVSVARGLDPRGCASLRGWRGDLLLQDELAHPGLLRENRRLRSGRTVAVVSIVHHLRSSERQGPVGRAAACAVERAYLRSVDAFVFNGEDTRRSVEKLVGAPARGIVAPPGGDRLGPGVSEDEAAARSREPGPLRVLFAGSLIPRKGLLGLLRALVDLPREAWHLVAAGPRGVDPAYERRVQQFLGRHGLGRNVSIEGHVGDDELARLMRAAHVLAVPSEYEGFGIVYLEAMGFGVVPIGSSAGGAAEVIESGTSGFLVAPGDREGLGGVLRRLSCDRSLLADLARGALRRCRRFPGWQQRMKEVRDWLHGLAGTAA